MMNEFQGAIIQTKEFETILSDLKQQIENTPNLYAQDGLGMNAIVHLHYFTSGSDWWITEFDPTNLLAFGYVCLNGDWQYAELGYVSIEELTSIDVVQMDFHWTPVTLNEALKNGGRK